jgi:L-lactate dehydrogenase
MLGHPTPMPTVSVVGAGHVGAAIASALVLLGTSQRIVLYDRHLARAEGEAWDIEDTTPLVHEVTVHPTDDYRDLAGSDVVVLTVGANLQPGQSRLDVLPENAEIFRSVIPELDRAVPDATLVIVSNPVDVLTRIAIECSARPEHRIFGSGTVVDTARLRYQLAQVLGASPEDTHVHVLGEHGDSQFVAWSSASIGAIPLAEYPIPAGTTLPEIQAQCQASTRRRGFDIYNRKGYTNYGVAAAVCRLVESIRRDEQRTYTVSTRALPEYGIGEDLVLGLPCTIGRGGISRRLVLGRDAAERRLLERSAAVLAAAYASLPQAPPAPPPTPPPAPG